MNKIYHPTIQQMRLLDAVARHNSVTRAAEEVSLSQPTVSMQISSLESKIGLQLTERIGKTIYLTQVGKEVALAARDVLSRLEQMEVSIDNIRKDVGGPLSIAAVSSAKYFMPQLLGRFKRQFPKVKPNLRIANRENILTRMNQNADDFYVMGQPPKGRALIGSPFLKNEIVLIAPAGHPLSDKKDIKLKQLEGEFWIGRERGSGTRKAVEDFFQSQGVLIEPSMSFDENESIKQAVSAGLGIAYVSRLTLRLELQAQEISILDVKGFPLRRQWYAVHNQEKVLSKSAIRFHEFLEKLEG